MPLRARFLVPFAACILAAAPLSAQSTSGSAVGELAALLERGRLDSVAARLPGSEDTFVAAFYIPGQQLVLVSGRYAAPALLREKILGKRYREAYQDLYGASDRATRVVIEDLRADGLQAARPKDGPSDVYTDGGGKPVFFDGEWKRHDLSKEDYLETFEQADTRYGQMLGVLVAALQAPGGA